MAIVPVDTIHLDRDHYNEAIEIVNEMAQVMNRNPHNAIDTFIKDEAPRYIESQKAIKQLQNRE